MTPITRGSSKNSSSSENSLLEKVASGKAIRKPATRKLATAKKTMLIATNNSFIDAASNSLSLAPGHQEFDYPANDGNLVNNHIYGHVLTADETLAREMPITNDTNSTSNKPPIRKIQFDHSDGPPCKKIRFADDFPLSTNNIYLTEDARPTKNSSPTKDTCLPASPSTDASPSKNASLRNISSRNEISLASDIYPTNDISSAEDISSTKDVFPVNAIPANGVRPSTKNAYSPDNNICPADDSYSTSDINSRNEGTTPSNSDIHLANNACSDSHACCANSSCPLNNFVPVSGNPSADHGSTFPNSTLSSGISASERGYQTYLLIERLVTAVEKKDFDLDRLTKFVEFYENETQSIPVSVADVTQSVFDSQGGQMRLGEMIRDSLGGTDGLVRTLSDSMGGDKVVMERLLQTVTEYTDDM